MAFLIREPGVNLGTLVAAIVTLDGEIVTLEGSTLLATFARSSLLGVRRLAVNPLGREGEVISPAANPTAKAAARPTKSCGPYC
jgi:hypothetical protein